jgi:hypothetical protein
VRLRLKEDVRHGIPGNYEKRSLPGDVRAIDRGVSHMVMVLYLYKYWSSTSTFFFQFDRDSYLFLTRLGYIIWYKLCVCYSSSKLMFLCRS